MHAVHWSSFPRLKKILIHSILYAYLEWQGIWVSCYFSYRGIPVEALRVPFYVCDVFFVRFFDVSIAYTAKNMYFRKINVKVIRDESSDN